MYSKNEKTVAKFVILSLKLYIFFIAMPSVHVYSSYIYQSMVNQQQIFVNENQTKTYESNKRTCKKNKKETRAIKLLSSSKVVSHCM